MEQNTVFQYQFGRHLWFARQKDYIRHFHYPPELIVALDGDFILTVDDVDYTIKKDECGIIFPYQFHGIKEINCDTAIIIFGDPGWGPDFQKYFTEYLPVSNRVAMGSFPDWIPELVRKYKRTSYIYVENGRRDNIMSASMDGLAQLIYAEILKTLPMVKSDEKRDINTFNTVIHWCNLHYTESITLDDAARDLFLSRSSISHMMSVNLRVSFTRYINFLRAGRACELLRNSDLPISDIAFESGFGSIWSFNRNFRELVGVTPGEYRNK